MTGYELRIKNTVTTAVPHLLKTLTRFPVYATVVIWDEKTPRRADAAVRRGTLTMEVREPYA